MHRYIYIFAFLSNLMYNISGVLVEGMHAVQNACTLHAKQDLCLPHGCLKDSSILILFPKGSPVACSPTM